MTHCEGATSCQSKAQLITALSSAKAELIAAVTAAKNVKRMRSVLAELGIPEPEPTPMCGGNKSAVKIINGNKPTGRSRHINI